MRADSTVTRPLLVAFEAGFYPGLILGAFNAVTTISAGDGALHAWGFWSRVAVVVWAAAVHGLILGAALALVAAVLLAIRLVWRRNAKAGAPRPHPRVQRLAPILILAGLLLVLEGVDAWIVRRGEGSNERLNVVLIVVDALRADRLGCYGYPLPTSPHIDTLAGSGVVFERAVVQYPATGPSFGSLFTGKYPRKHGLSGMDPRLWLGGDFNQTLAEILSAHGYETGGVITGSLTRSSGLARGFHELFEEMPAYGTYDVRSPLQTLRSRLPIARDWVRRRLAADPKLVTSEAERWLDRKRDARFFLFVHLYDTHAPYDPAREYLEPVHSGGPVYPPLFSEELRALEERAEALSPAEIQRVSALYDGEVRSADASVGRIVAQLDRLGLRQKTVIVVTADHGEELYDHGKLEHGHIFNTNLLVPLIISAPGHTQPGTRIDSPVELIDLMPTLLATLGISVPNGADGRALSLDAGGAVQAESHAFSEADCGPAADAKACLIAVQDRHWKLIVDRTQGTRQLFDLERDPLERTDSLDQNRQVAEQLEAALRKWDSSQPDLALLQKKYEGVEISEEIRERLRQLGYIE